MGDPRGFIKIARKAGEYRPVCERVKDYKWVGALKSLADSQDQASRCMDCGTPFCNFGCPLGNYIPEWNDAVFNRRWEKAFELLDSTNPLPEVTGRVCPAPCEDACVLGINDDPVTIRENELAIIEQAFEKGCLKPPPKRSGKKVAVVGSGPAGLACAAELNQLGHTVTVFEKDLKIGGILRYGIPDFKLEKSLLDRRVQIWQKAGIKFKVNTEIKNVSRLPGFDAICVAVGCRTPRDLKLSGRKLKGIYFAMDYLTQSNQRVGGERVNKKDLIDAKGKKVVVIGGGDTGADCVGTAHRQGADCVVQIEILPKPEVFKTSTSHQEGGQRQWLIETRKFLGKNGRLAGLLCLNKDTNQEFEIEADLAIVAAGFLKSEIKTKKKNIFYAGDVVRGPSLIVWALWEGIQAAQKIHRYLRK